MAKRRTNTTRLLKMIVDAILDKKGKEVVTLDLRKIKDAPSDYFIITHGDSNTQVRAIYDHVIEKVRENKILPYRTESGRGAEWMIIDFVDVTVHVFYREKREFYALEELWSDARRTEHSAEKSIVK